MSISHDRGPHEPIRQLSAAMLRDPYLRLQLATILLVAGFYLLPMATDAQREFFSWTWLCSPFMIWPVLGCFAGIGRLGEPERHFWRLIGAGLACWLAALVVYGTLRTAGSPDWAVVVVDFCYLASYVLLFLAVDGRQDLGGEDSNRRLEQRLRALGFAVFAFGWSCYFVILPTLAGGADRWPAASEGVMFVVLDLAFFARLYPIWRTATTPRWKQSYGLIGLATLALTLTDTVGFFESFGIDPWRAARVSDILWALPGTIFLVAVRAPHVLPAATTALSGVRPDEGATAHVGTFLMLGALSFPLVHSIADGLQLLPIQNRTLQTGLWVVTACSALVLSVLAVLAQRALAGERAKVARERRDLEAQLLQAQKMEAIGRIAGGLAHDFNNLLTTIAGYTDLVIENTPPQDANRPMLEEVRSATDRAGSLTGQLLAFSRRQTVKVEPINLNQLVAGMRDLVRRVVGEAITLDIQTPAEAAWVAGNTNQFEQALLNLVVNARDAMPSGGTLTLAVAAVDLDCRQVERHPWLKPGRYARLSVTDTGAGIPGDVLPHIFDPFFTTKDEGRGSGLGLSMVYGSVRQFGGAVDVDTAAGRGTTISLLLPSRAAASTADATVPPSRDGGTETILLAEDDVQVRQLTRAILSRQGYLVLEATSAPDAARLAETHLGHIDLVLTDVVMPELSGPLLAQRVRGRRPDVRVLFMSGYTDQTRGPAAQLPASDDFMPKPFTPPQLVRAVRLALDHEV